MNAEEKSTKTNKHLYSIGTILRYKDTDIYVVVYELLYESVLTEKSTILTQYRTYDLATKRKMHVIKQNMENDKIWTKISDP